MTKKQKKSPAFQFYPSDFLGSPKVRAMTVAEIGLYTLALCLDWESNGFTVDELQAVAASQRMTPKDFEKCWGRVRDSFRERSGKCFNDRLNAERKKQAEWRRKSSKGGKLGMKKRWKEEDKGAVRVVTPLDNTPSPSPSPSPKQQLRTADDAIFAEAWAEYPKRPGNSKSEAYRQWLARVKDGVDPLAMLEGTRSYAKYIKANPPEEARFIKQAQTFYGRGKHFEADWTPSSTTDSRILALVEEEDAALERTRKLLESRGAA